MAGQRGRPKKQPDPEELERAEGHSSDWRHSALCQALPPYMADAMFFPTDQNDPLAAYRRDFCSRCPVQQECLTYGNIVHPDYGAYGGYNDRERRAMLRSRKHIT